MTTGNGTSDDNQGGTPGNGRDPVLILRTTVGMRTDVDIGRHHMVVDEPVNVGGTDQGPSPARVLVAALATCASITARMYADRKGWPLDEIVIRAWHHRINEKEGSDAAGVAKRVDLFESEIDLVGDLSAEQRERLLEIAGRCPVKRTLEGEPRFRYVLADVC
jgi:putative redox protein